MTRRDSGFSLIELLVAFTIMGMSLAVLYQVSGGNVRNAAETRMQARAVLLARSLLESRDSIPDAGFDLRGRADGLDWTLASTAYVAPGDLPVSFHRVVARVTWVDRQRMREIELATLLPVSRKP